MSCYYKECCDEFGWKMDQQLLTKMESKNKEEFVKLDAKIAEEKEYESDEKDALIAKAEYLCQIGNRVCLKDLNQFTFNFNVLVKSYIFVTKNKNQNILFCVY